MQVFPPIKQISAEVAARPQSGFQRSRNTGFAEVMAAGMGSDTSVYGQVRRAMGNSMHKQMSMESPAAPEAPAVPKDDEIDTALVMPFMAMAAAGLTPPAETVIEDDSTMAAEGVADILEGQTNDYTDMDNPEVGTELPGDAAAPSDGGILARMPDTVQQTGSDTRQIDANAPDGAELDGGSCPLENASDSQTVAQTAPAAQEAPVREAEGKNNIDTARFEDYNATSQEAGRIPAEAAAQSTGEREAEAGLESNAEDEVKAPEADAATVPAATSFQVDAAPLRVQGEGQMVRQTQATRETLMDTMVQEISMESAGESRTVEIQLKPEFLGKVSIQITMDGNGIQAKIRAEDPEVKGLIGGQINQLIESLEQKGIRMSAVDVVYTGTQAGSFEQGGQNREGMNQEDRNRPLEAKAVGRSAPGYASALDADAGADPDTVLDSETSSVEFHA